MGIVVDALEHLQGLMNLVASMSSISLSGELSIVAMKFKEPTYTMNDEFLGITDDGRLIQVEEELSSITTSLLQDDTIKKPQMLPLSMLCKSLGVAVHPYDIQGNPDEFPVELAKLTSYYNCNLVLIPWRPSVYLKQFFWSSLKALDCNIAVVAQLNVSVSTVPEGRNRAGTIHNPRDERDRKYSYTGSDGEDSYTPDSSNIRDPTSERQKYHNNRNAVSVSKKSSITDILPINIPRKPISTVLIVLTGLPTDDAVISLAMLYSENATIKVTMLFPNDIISPTEAKYENYKMMIKAKSNVTIKTIASSINADLVLAQMSDVQYDLVVTSFFEPTTKSDYDNVTPRARSASLYRSTMTESTPDIREINSAIGVMSSLQDDLCPELGLLGSKMYQSNVSTSLLMVLHDIRGKSIDNGSSDVDIEGGIELTGLNNN